MSEVQRQRAGGWSGKGEDWLQVCRLNSKKEKSYPAQKLKGKSLGLQDRYVAGGCVGVWEAQGWQI